MLRTATASVGRSACLPAALLLLGPAPAAEFAAMPATCWCCLIVQLLQALLAGMMLLSLLTLLILLSCCASC
jgi:hypothetical protein